MVLSARLVTVAFGPGKRLFLCPALGVLLWLMLPVLLVCADCEHHALHHPKQGRVLAGALGRLLGLLQGQDGLQGLAVQREECLHDCVLGTVCVILQQDHQEVRHHLSPQDDLKAVAAKLAAPASAS